MITLDATAPIWAHTLVSRLNQILIAMRPDNAVKVTGGSINGTTVGLTTPASAAFTTTQVAGLTSTQTITGPGVATLMATTAALTDGAAGNVGTLNNAPAAGNPTKWIAINDGGTVRKIPAW